MSSTFLEQFLTRQRQRGHTGPLFDQLAKIAQGSTTTPQPAPAPVLTPAPAPSPVGAPPTRCRTVQEIAAARPLSRVQFEQTPAPRVQVNPVESLTACMDAAPCPTTARRIFRLLFELGLDSTRARGLPVRPDVAIFHLPLELLAAHLEIDRVTVWRNVRHLVALGILAERDHYSTLRGQTAVSGKVWAVSLCPERVLSGHAAPVRVTMADLRFPWRDLDRDARQGRTVYAATRSEARQAAEKAEREARRAEDAEARARAAERAAARAEAKARGEKVPTGRRAATLNAAETRAQRGPRRLPPGGVQQSKEGLKTVGKIELRRWVLAPFSKPSEYVTPTVAGTFSDGLDAAFTLPTLAGLSRTGRSEMVEKTARTLAASFGDSDNLRFWCWLLWQTLRAYDQGQDWTEDVAHIIARVLHDVKHEAQLGAKVSRPAALVVNGLRNCGLLDALKATAPTRVGRRPRAA